MIAKTNIANVLCNSHSGTLETLLRDEQKALPWSERLRLAKDVAHGMNYLQSRKYEPVVHGGELMQIMQYVKRLQFFTHV